MKSLYLTFDDEEFKKMAKLKDQSGWSWEKFILSVIKLSDIEKLRKHE